MKPIRWQQSEFSETLAHVRSLGVRPENLTIEDVDAWIVADLISHVEADAMFKAFFPKRLRDDPYCGPSIKPDFQPTSCVPKETDQERKERLKRKELEYDEAKPDTVTDGEWAAYERSLLARFHAAVEKSKSESSLAA